MARACRLVLRASGIILVLLGLAHLAATPHIPDLIRGLRGTRDYPWALGPTLLNHVLVGVLLLPLGLSTWLAAGASTITQRWARAILVGNTLAVLALPAALVIFMRAKVYYSAPLFVAGVSLTALAAVLMAMALAGVLFGPRNGPS
jgi:hypothetical protein